MTVTATNAGRGYRHRGRQAARRGRAAAAVTAVSCTALLVAGAGLVTAGAAVGAQAATLRVNWGTAEEVPGLGALNAGGNAAVNVVSCWRAGDCAAGGFYHDASGHQQAFVVTEHNGRWGEAEEVPGTAVLNGDDSASSAQVSTLSCAPRSGYCTAAGEYDSGGTQQVFVVSETKDQWGTAIEIPGVGELNVGGDAWVGAVSCPSAGSCSAGGFYQTPVAAGTPIGQDAQAFVVSQSRGQWAKAEEVPGMQAVSPPPFQVNYVRSMSCRSAGNCTAAGIWNAGSNGSPTYGQDGGFVVSEVKGHWQHLRLPVRGGGDSLVACWRAGDCLATAGNSVVIQTRGRWGKAHHFAALSGDVIAAVSCPSAGNCTVAGFLGYSDSDYGGYNPAFVLAERDGHWGRVYHLKGLAGTQLSDPFAVLRCASAGNCGGGGTAIAGFDDYGDILGGAFVVGERDGKWTAAETPPGLAALNAGGNAGVNAVSCPVASTCAAVGFYTDAGGHQQAFVQGSV
jgi:hypothetical protein